MNFFLREESPLSQNSQERVKKIRLILGQKTNTSHQSLIQNAQKIFKPKNSWAVLLKIPKFEMIKLDEDKSRQLNQLKQIKQFGEAFIFDYGPFLISSAVSALQEGFTLPGMKEQVVDLLFKIMGAEVLKEEECKDSASIFKQRLMLLAKEACRENLDSLLEEVSKAVSGFLEQSDLKKGFIEGFLDVIAPMCFVESSGGLSNHKNVIVNILKGIREFVGDLNKCISQLSSRESGPLSIESEQYLLLELLRVKMEEKNLFCMIPPSQDPMIIQENFRKEVEDVVSIVMGLGDAESSPEQQLLHLSLSSYFSSMIKRLLSSETLMMIIHHLLKTPLDLSKGHPETQKQDIKFELDPKYTETLSFHFQGIFNEILNLSGTSETIKSIVYWLNPLILPLINKGAHIFHEGMEERSKKGHLNDSIISLLMVADQLLYIEKKENHSSLKKYFSMKSDEIQQIREDVDKQIGNRPAEFIKEMIQKNFSSVVSVALQMLQPESYFQNLVDRLYRLSQQETLLMVAFSYIRQAIFNCKMVNLNEEKDGMPDEWVLTDFTSEFVVPVVIESKEIVKPNPQFSAKSNERSARYEILKTTTVFKCLSIEKPKKVNENEIRIVEQFNLIDSFTRAFFVHYGSYIFSSADKAICEALKNPKTAVKLTELIFKAVLPAHMQSSDGLFSSTMASICQQIFQNALPNIVNFMSKLATPIVEDQLTGPDFINVALDYLTPMLFNKCSSSPDLQKIVILNLCVGVKDFLSDLNSCTHKAATQQKYNTEENLVDLMKEKMRAKKIPIPSDADAKEVIFLQLEDALKVMIGDQGGNANVPLLSFLLNTYLSSILNRLFSPDTLCIFLERIFLKPLDFSCKPKGPTEIKKKKTLNQFYTNDLSLAFQGLSIEILKLAGTSNELLKVVELIAPLLKGKINEYTDEVHRVLDDMANTESINDILVTPIFFLDQILYDKRTNIIQKSILERRPSFLKFMNISEEELFKMRERLDFQIKNESKDRIRGLINNNLSLPLRLTLNFLPTEEFCQNLTDRLYWLSQNDALLKMLLGYLIRSVKIPMFDRTNI